MALLSLSLDQLNSFSCRAGEKVGAEECCELTYLVCVYLPHVRSFLPSLLFSGETVVVWPSIVEAVVDLSFYSSASSTHTLTILTSMKTVSYPSVPKVYF